MKPFQSNQITTSGKINQIKSNFQEKSNQIKSASQKNKKKLSRKNNQIKSTSQQKTIKSNQPLDKKQSNQHI